MTENKRSIFIKFVFIILCIALNLGGNFFTTYFELPFWLDTIGTGLTACVYGPLYGGITGICSNLCLGITNWISAFYGIVNFGLGILIGFLYRKGMLKDLFSTLCASIITAFFTLICAVPVSLIFYEGHNNNKWGNALFDMLGKLHIGVIAQSILAQAFVDIPDKVISLILVFFILKLFNKYGFPARLEKNE